LSITKLESKFTSSLQSGNIPEAKSLIAKHPKVIKLFGAQIWEQALKSREQVQAINFLISIKAPVYMPKSNAKKVVALSDYTMILSIKYKSKELLKHLLDNYKINSKLLNDAIIKLCNVHYFTDQVGMLYNLFNGGGIPTYKGNRAIFNATLAENGKIIVVLIEQGSYLINQRCAELFLTATNQDPLTYLSICIDERSHPAIMGTMTGDKPTDMPLEHFE
jgi:hypothetical protein